MTYWVDFSEGGQVRDAGHNLVASFSFINTRTGGRKESGTVKTQADLFADALNVHDATGLTPSQLQARVAELEAAINRLKIYIVGLPDGLTRDHMLDHVAELEAAQTKENAVEKISSRHAVSGD